MLCLIFLVSIIAVLSSPEELHEKHNFKRTATMTCGPKVKLCGILTLESGYGPDSYNHPLPGVHGLWPENGEYGTSECIAPQNIADPVKIYSCYNDTTQTDASNLAFEIHEWEKHGACAGVQNENDYFTQVCSLAANPLKIMTIVKNQGGDLDAMAKAVTKEGYEIYEVDTVDSQLELSVCAPSTGKWVFSAIADFTKNCGF